MNATEPVVGVSGLESGRRNRFFPYKVDYPVDLSDCYVIRPRPFRIEITEPLPVVVPRYARPYCCYISTVIFYRAANGWDEFDRCETRLSWEDVVTFEGDEFVIGGGEVVWTDRWVMKRWARRIDVA